VKCKRCGRFGHNARNCKNAVDPSFGEESLWEDEHENEENALEPQESALEPQDGPSRYYSSILGNSTFKFCY
jgi:hypothetical protein